MEAPTLCQAIDKGNLSVQEACGGLPRLPRGPLTASLLPPLVPHHSASVLGVTSPSLPQAIDSLCPQLSAVILWLLSSFLRSRLKPRGPSISLLASSVTAHQISCYLKYIVIYIKYESIINAYLITCMQLMTYVIEHVNPFTLSI